MFDRSSSLASDTDADPLTEMLRGLRLDGVEYHRGRMSGAWCLHYPVSNNAAFHFVSGRACVFQDSHGTWTELAPGDAILIARGASHSLASSPGIPPVPFAHCDCRAICENVSDYTSVAQTASEPVTTLFSGTMRFNLDPLHPLLRMMPETMRAQDLLAAEPALLPLLEAMSAECAMNRVGASGILSRLADVIAAQIIRSWVEHGCGEAEGWVAAVRDPSLGRVIAAIHADPARDWRVADLAEIMNVSRSGFAAKFTASLGVAPARYLAEVRMRQARQWIGRDRMRVSEAARRLGYESEAAFSRAFKRVVGVAPSSSRNASPALDRLTQKRTSDR